MSKLDPKIHKTGIVYSITGLKTGKMYIGSTTETLSRRISKHKYNLKCMAGDIIYYEPYDVVILETLKNIIRLDLIKKEVEYQEKNKDMIINKRNELRTENQWKIDNKNIICESKKIWYENNKEKLKIKYSEIFNCECGSKIKLGEKSRHNKSLKHLKSKEKITF